MENNSLIEESLILFYINMKHQLQTKNLDKCAFLNQMVNYCKERGLNKINDGRLKYMWMSLITKYLSLKSEGTPQEKENWKYFEILDSCYEASDFSTHKLTDDIIWLMIECFLKMRRFKKAQQLDMFIDVHKEFLEQGYTHISKRYLKDKWKYLNSKCLESSTTKVPHLEAIKALQEEHSTVSMAFTRNLTEQLIAYFTQLKVMCIIHGYDSEKVLNEVQSKFKNQGVYFSKDAIKEKWNKLTNIYKFLTAKGKIENSWIHFNSVKNHCDENFLCPKIESSDENVEVQNFKVKRCLRLRSKSIGPEISKNWVKESPENTNDNKSIKRIIGNHRSPQTRKKLKIEEIYACKITKPSLKGNSEANISETSLKSPGSEKSIPTGENVHIININESDIDHKNGSLTINIPSITKQFSDNEFLPLKKRLRMNKSQDLSEDQLKDTPEQISIDEKVISNPLSVTSLTENEKLISKIHDEASSNNSKLDASLNELNDGSRENKSEISKSHEENALMSKTASPNSTKKAPVVCLVIKMDGSRRFLKSNILSEADLKGDKVNNLQSNGSTSDIKIDSGFITKQECTLPVYDDFVKPNSLESTTIPTNEEVIDIKNGTSATDGEVIVLDDESVSSENPYLPDSESKLCTKNDVIDLDAVVNSETHVSENLTLSPNYSKNEQCSYSDVIILDSVDNETPVKPKENVQMLLDHGSNYDIIDLDSVHECEAYLNPKNTTILTNGMNREENIKEFSKVQTFAFPENNTIKCPPKSVPNSECNRNISDIPCTPVNTITPTKRTWPGFKFVSQVIQGPITGNIASKMSTTPSSSTQSVPESVGPCGVAAASSRTEDFDSESLISEAIGEDEVSKDNLLATVIDFQEQNNSEFIEIKNLMKQNNLLQRETNRLLRLLIEQM